METLPTPTFARIIPNELLRNARIVSRREDLLPLVPKRKVFVEVGVALGDFSESVLRQCDVTRFIAIDLFVLHHAPTMWGGRVGQTLGGLDHLDYFRRRLAKYAEEGRLEIMKGDSIECLERLADQSADVFYVDANHSYSSVKAELEIIKQKIAPGGWIILNDYIMEDWLTKDSYGVVQAVNEFMITENWEMLYFALHSGMFCDVVLRQVPSMSKGSSRERA
jgi:hypothetical protein